MLLQVSPLLYTDNLEESIKFYSEVLGFTVRANEPEFGWAAVRRDNLDVMLSLPTEHVPFDGPKFTGAFFFFTNNLKELWESFNKPNVKIAYEPKEFDYGMTEFAIYDNNGYLLQFGQESLQ